MKIVVYTAIFGDKDNIKEPINYNEIGGVDYFLITDRPQVKSNNYKTISKRIKNADVAKNARYYKINGLKEFETYDYVIWHDANLQLLHNTIPDLIECVKKKQMATFLHPKRTNFYDEAIACVLDKKEEPLRLFYQCLSYFRKNISPYSGLYETSILVKNNRIGKNMIYKSWWEEIRKYSRRDQISLPYILNKYKVSPGILQGERLKSPYAIYNEHNYHDYILTKNRLVMPGSLDGQIIKCIEVLKKLSRRINSQKPLSS